MCQCCEHRKGKDMEKKKKKKLLWFYVVIALVWVMVFAIMGLEDDEAEPTETKKEEVQKEDFTMRSNDSIGANGYIVGKSGKYEIVCTKGHGALIINDADLMVLASDEYIGQEYSGLTYEVKMVVELKDRDELLARAYNSSDFKLEFYFIE